MSLPHTFKTWQYYRPILGFIIFTALAIALYFHIGKYWHLSTNFSQLNFTKTQGKVLQAFESDGSPSYLIGFQILDSGDSLRLAHSNYFTDHFEKGDTLTVYVSRSAVRVPKVDGMDHYIWFLLFCFGICAYMAALGLRKHLFRSKP